MQKVAVIVAGGSGSRMGSNIPKQFLLLKGKPVLWYTLRTFLQAFPDLKIVLVLPPNNKSEGKKLIEEFDDKNRISIVDGGVSRFHSVKNGLSTIKEQAVVFVHDGVRCLVTVELIRKCFFQTIEKGNAVPAVSSTDSIRLEENGHNKFLPRENVRIVQTPQTFLSTVLLPAFEQLYSPLFTDEANVVEQFGEQIFLIEGEYTNIKITRPVDLILAEQILDDMQKS